MIGRREATWTGRVCLAPNAAHVLLDGPLADLDPELAQLAADALGTDDSSNLIM
jgi:hypothetical protein